MRNSSTIVFALLTAFCNAMVVAVQHLASIRASPKLKGVALARYLAVFDGRGFYEADRFVNFADGAFFFIVERAAVRTLQMSARVAKIRQRV